MKFLLFTIKNHIFISVVMFFLLFKIPVFAQNTNTADTSTLNSQINPQNIIKLSDVVKFTTLSYNDINNKELSIRINTKDDFKIYADNLKFGVLPKDKDSFPLSLTYTSSVPVEKYFDPFSKKMKGIFRNNTIFKLHAPHPLTLEDEVLITAQSCSDSVCLLPATLSLAALPGAVSHEVKSDDLSSSVKEISDTLLSVQTSGQKPSVSKEYVSLENKITFLNDNVASHIQNALMVNSFVLFPALFFAGLLMNLTPCVYPMIPITLNVMAQFGAGINLPASKRKKRRRILPFVYVGGMILTYSLLGVFAGMTGNIFGSQLSSSYFMWTIAVILFLLGFSMLGGFNFNFVQALAHKIPHTKNYPYIAVGTMGALSGLVAAPCTGPVLSTILLLIAQNKDPISGFTYMFVFSLGFGLPYAALGFIEQSFLRMPRFPRIVLFIKVFFASLMFALAFYYIRDVMQNIPYLRALFVRPEFGAVIFITLLGVIFSFFAIKRKLIGKLAKTGLIICCSLLALWLTLKVTNTFRATEASAASAEIIKKSLLHWQTDYNAAMLSSQETHKPILVDIWADWCVACLKMEETVWQDKNLVNYLNQNYILLKLDDTNMPDDVVALLSRWGILGLPATVFFKTAHDLEGKPTVLFQGETSAEKLLSTAKELNR